MSDDEWQGYIGSLWLIENMVDGLTPWPETFDRDAIVRWGPVADLVRGIKVVARRGRMARRERASVVAAPVVIEPPDPAAELRTEVPAETG